MGWDVDIDQGISKRMRVPNFDSCLLRSTNQGDSECIRAPPPRGTGHIVVTVRFQPSLAFAGTQRLVLPTLSIGSTSIYHVQHWLSADTAQVRNRHAQQVVPLNSHGHSFADTSMISAKRSQVKFAFFWQKLES